MLLNVKAFSLTCGLLWAVGVVFLTWWIIAREGATGELLFLGRFYIGYDVTPLGSVIGAAWALVDGLIGGAIFAWLYNRIASRMHA